MVGAIRKGEWKIPRFQREFVWEKKKVIELLDSMYKGFPIGSFFLWVPTMNILVIIKTFLN
ncbi:MAG: DUF262 domain-containing protein [Candidatus Scalinduaceae bacterium]